MHLVRSLLGRRQFLIAFVSSTLALVSRRFTKTLGFLFHNTVAKASEKWGLIEENPSKVL